MANVKRLRSTAGSMATTAEVISVRARAVQHRSAAKVPTTVRAWLLAVSEDDFSGTRVAGLQQDAQTDNDTVIEAREPGRQLRIRPGGVGPERTRTPRKVGCAHGADNRW